MNPNTHLQKMVLAALMAALTTAGAYMAIPIGPVPIVLQNLFVLLSGLLLGSRWGAASIGVYLLAGFLGLPVFAGGTSGLAKLMGPTGGYLVGYLAAAYLVGLVAERSGGRLWINLLGLVAGSLLIYLCGVTWLKAVLDISLSKALAMGMWPFLPGDAAKIVAALALGRTLEPLVAGRVRPAPNRFWSAGPLKEDA
jgi:biotin transport system substrate-specific component